MLYEIFSFEFKSWIRNKSTYVFIAILFGLGFLLTNFYGLAIGRIFVLSTLKIDSAPQINSFLTLISLVGTAVTSMIMGLAVYKDYQYNTFAITFTSASSKFNYLFGRFSGALAVCLLISTAPFLGFVAGIYVPWTADINFGASQFGAYFYTYLTKTVPLIFYTGALFFSLSTLLKNTIFNWLVIGIIYGLYSFVSGIFADRELENYHRLMALLDPLGVLADKLAIRDWSTPDKNAKLLPFSQLLLFNRLIWMGFGTLALLLTYVKIDLYARTSKFRFWGLVKRQLTDSISTKGIAFGKISFPVVARSFSFKANISLWRRLTAGNLKRIIFNPFFLLILVFTFFFISTGSRTFGNAWGTNSYPFTHILVGQFANKVHIIITMCIVWFTGELVWRDRRFNTNEITDTYPVANRIFLLSNFSALVVIPFFFFALVIYAGIKTQLQLGFNEHEIGLFLQELLAIRYVDYILYTVLAMLVFSLINNKFLSIFIMIIYFIIESRFLRQVIPHNMLIYGSDPGKTYSEFTGYANTLYPYYIFKLYWLGFAGLLAFITSRIWHRGTDVGLKYTWNRFKERLSLKDKYALTIFASIFLLTGGFIYYNIYGLGNYQNMTPQDQADYEKEYKQYEDLVLPKITDVYVELDLYPESQNYDFRGNYWLKNKSDQPIDKIVVNYSDKLETNAFTFGIPSIVEKTEPLFNLHLHQLSSPLEPGDSMRVDFDFSYIAKGFYNNSSSLLSGKPLTNGTFMNNGFLPGFGYNSGYELVYEEQRAEYGLSPKNISPKPIGDPKAQSESWLGKDADFINFETIVSTVKGETAISPGYLQESWEKDDRAFFHYKMDAPIQNFYSFLSGKYEVRKEEWNGISLEIYYHPRHTYNLDKMMESMKKSLAYFSENFSPYQYRQMRIIEFPRFRGSFAQSFPNTVPFSESIGFTSDLRDMSTGSARATNSLFGFQAARRDVPFYVTAHELAHQWWAHQVISGNVEGFNFLSEAMSQYSALMVIEKVYGKEEARNYVKNELQTYLRGRGSDNFGEQPLARARGGQQYLHYNKGAVALYALRNYIGEEVLNGAIKRFVKSKAFQEPPYTNTMEFLDEVRAVTPDSLQYIIDDWFEDIILYDNEVIEATYMRTEDFDYEVEFKVNLKKLRADSKGNESEIPLNDFIDIAIMNDGQKILHTQRIRFTENEATFKILVSRKPDRIVIDPDFSLTDKSLMNNSFKIDRKTTE